MGCFSSKESPKEKKGTRPTQQNAAEAEVQRKGEVEKRRLEEENKEAMRIAILQKKNENVPPLRMQDHPLYQDRVHD